MLQEALIKIRETEEEAARQVTQARRDAVSLEEKTSHELAALREEARRERQRRRERLLAEAEERGRQRAERLLAEERAKIEEMIRAARSRKPSVVEALSGRLAD